MPLDDIENTNGAIYPGPFMYRIGETIPELQSTQFLSKKEEEPRKG